MIRTPSVSKSLQQIAVEAVLEAGAEIMKYYESAFGVREKSPDNPVTDADLAADHLLKDRLLSLMPKAGWLSEETRDDPSRLSKEYCWIVDPVDGTKEFVFGIPEFTVSVGLVFKGHPILGIIFNPATGELYHATKNGGLLLNAESVVVSERPDLPGANVEASRSERKRGEFAPFEELVQVRTMGSIAYKLARLSGGLSDATWSRGPKNEWDICAGALLITEGGGKVTDLDNAPILFNKAHPKVNGIIASNGRLHEKVVEMLAPHRHTARVDK